MIPRDPAALVDEARKGSRTALARLLTYVESGGENQRATAALAYAAPAPWTVGLTGPPGAGKSTLTDSLVAAAGIMAIEQVGNQPWQDLSRRRRPLELAGPAAASPAPELTRRPLPAGW